MKKVIVALVFLVTLTANGCIKKVYVDGRRGSRSDGGFGRVSLDPEILILVVHNFAAEELAIALPEAHTGVIAYQQSRSVSVAYYPGNSTVFKVEAYNPDGSIHHIPGGFLIQIALPFFATAPQQKIITIKSVDTQQFDIQ